MRGRKPTPTFLKLVTGNPGHRPINTDEPIVPPALPDPHPAPTAVPLPTPAATAIDPVCHMQVGVATARHTAQLDGDTYYFCCANCRARFLKDPQPYRPHAS